MYHGVGAILIIIILFEKGKKKILKNEKRYKINKIKEIHTNEKVFFFQNNEQVSSSQSKIIHHGHKTR